MERRGRGKPTVATFENNRTTGILGVHFASFASRVTVAIKSRLFTALTPGVQLDNRDYNIIIVPHQVYHAPVSSLPVYLVRARRYCTNAHIRGSNPLAVLEVK